MKLSLISWPERTTGNVLFLVEPGLSRPPLVCLADNSLHIFCTVVGIFVNQRNIGVYNVYRGVYRLMFRVPVEVKSSFFLAVLGTQLRCALGLLSVQYKRCIITFHCLHFGGESLFSMDSFSTSDASLTSVSWKFSTQRCFILVR